MLAYSLGKKNKPDPSLASDVADAQMVARMRLVLAISVVFAIAIDPSMSNGASGSAWLVFAGYALHSVSLHIWSQVDATISQSKLIHWLDVCWYCLIVVFSGGIHSLFFLLFFFAIITSSLRWGFEEGARITIASATLFAASGLVTHTDQDLLQLLMRTTFLLALGYMCAHWGEAKVALKRRLDLLRDVSHLSNPRFGVDHTIASVLEKTRTFFKGSRCVLVMVDSNTASCQLRTVGQASTPQSISPDNIGIDAAKPLIALSAAHLHAYRPRNWGGMRFADNRPAYDLSTGEWVRHDVRCCENMAELMEARSFISVPLALRKGPGRIYVLSDDSAFSKADALFLAHISAQAFPVIESIELVDRMASEAASQERTRFALNLHDTAIQPYIGLKLGLNAVRNKAAPDNPLVEDLDRLATMATQVIADLRQFAGTYRAGQGKIEPVFLVVLRQQAAQIKTFYGIDIGVSMVGDLNVSDRVTAEALQFVREGLSNICRHTAAQRAFVKLECANGWLKIRIENEGSGMQSTQFTPRSIIERALALGGRAHVTCQVGGTIVHIEIPV